MRKITAFLLLALCISLLSGCGCKHEWTVADCTTAKTCSLCEETEGVPLGHSWEDATCEAPKICSACALTEGAALGHSWVDATCDTPKTCSVCALTEGDAPGHSFGSWEVGEETMTRRCSSCGTEESVPTDWNVALSDLVSGRWVCTEVNAMERKLDMYVYFPQIPFLEVGSDQSIRFFNGKTEHQGTLLYKGQMDKDNIHSNVFQAIQDGTPQFAFAHQTIREGDVTTELIYGTAGLGSYKFERETEEHAAMRQALVGAWTSDKTGYSSVTFRDDYSLTIEINGEQIEASWSPSSFYESESEISCSYYLRYIKDNQWEQFLASLTFSLKGEALEEADLRIMFDGESVYYTAA